MFAESRNFWAMPKNEGSSNVSIPKMLLSMMATEGCP